MLSSIVTSSPVDGFVFHITDRVDYEIYSAGVNKGNYKIITKVPNSSCVAELSAYSLASVVANDPLSFNGRVAKLTCTDTVEQRMYSGEMMLSLWLVDS